MLVRNAWRWLAPLASVFFICTVAISVGYTVNADPPIYTGGLSPPYVSDTGSTPPRDAFFGIGLSLGGGTFGLLGILFALSTAERNVYSKVARYSAIIHAIFAVVGGVCCAGLGLLSTLYYPTAHLLAALGFFACATVVVTTGTIVLWFIRRDDDPFGKEVAKSYWSKVVLAALFWICVIIYLPVGLAITCWEHDEETDTFDYTECLWQNRMRVYAQYGTILFLALWEGSLFWDIFTQDEDQRSQDVSLL